MKPADFEPCVVRRGYTRERLGVCCELPDHAR